MKKWLTGVLAVCLLALLIMPVSAALPAGVGMVTSCKNVSGSEFSPKSSVAKKLDAMFAGNIGLYKDSKKTKLVDAALGTSNVPNNGVYQYWGDRAGTSCFAYANAFYAHFYDGTYPHGSLNGNHQKVKASGKITYKNFVKWGVRDDAAVYIREGNHSVIVLHYDENYITYVDGNGNGKGLIALRKEAWKRNKGTNIYDSTPSLIVQPKTGYFAAGTMGKLPCTEGGSYHDWDDGKVTKNATCKETGLKVYTCQACKKTRQESIAKTSDHTYGAWTVTKEAACGTDGTESSVCSVCGNAKTRKIKAPEHTYGKFVTVKESTCTEKGTQEAACTLCGKKKTKTQKALGHDYGKTATIKEATIFSYGITEKTCSRCGKVKTTKQLCTFRDKTLGITLTAKEKVFSKNTQIIAEANHEQEQLQLALQEVSGKFAAYTLSAVKNEEAVQPKGKVTLELTVPEDFGDNIALYAVAEGAVRQLKSTKEEKILTAELEKLETLVLCDLDVPYVPPTTEPVPPPTQPAAQPVMQPETTAVAPRQATWEEESTDLLLMMLAVTVPVTAVITLVVALVVKKRKEKITMD